MILPTGEKLKEEAVNPKTLIGASKINPAVIPAPAIVHLALAMMNGEYKYTKYNWREIKVPSETYIGAMERHLLAYKDGEDFAGDSLVHHLAHIMACCAILLDAMEGGHLIDNRGHPGTASQVMARYNARLPEMRAAWERAKNGTV